MEPPRPTHIGRYEITDRLGAGGMGVVYLATDPLLRRTVAIKVLPAHDDDLRERFAREARSAASLKHNHVVTIYDIGEDDGKPFIAMEFLDGESMAEMVRRRAPLSVDRRLQLLLELCSGLGFAHKHGIIHRDIKPGNLMVTAEGSLKILDFGLARITSDVTSTGLTLAGSVMGTPHYMSPEQVEGKVVDPRSDIFSVGVVFYELLSYRKAYPGESAHVILHNIVHATPTPIRDLIPTIDPDLEAIVLKGLEKDPAKRYQTLANLAAEVTRIRAKFAASTEITTQIALPPGSGGRRSRERPSKATDTSPGRGTRHLASLDAIAQRRASQVDAHLKLAAEHFAAGRFQETIDSCENAVLLDSGEERALQLLAQAQGKLEDSQVQECLEKARACLSSGDLTAAEALIEQSLKLRADSAEAHELQRAIREQRRERERIAERARSAHNAAERARRSLEDGAFEAAMRSASEALAYDPTHKEALNLRQRATQAIEERQRRQEHDQRALEVADQARNSALADDPKGALTLLESFRPPHPVVDRALAELKAQLAEIERQRSEEEQRQRQQALENERRRNRAKAHKVTAQDALKNARFAEALAAVAAARNEVADDPELDEIANAIRSAKEAADAATRTRELVSRSVQASRVALERGELSAAADALKAGLDIAPRDPELRALGSSIRVAQQQLDANAAIASARQLAAAGNLDAGLGALESFTPRTLVAEALAELKAERLRLQQAQEIEARRRTEEEARKRTEEETRKRTEEEARKRTEEEARKRTEEEARKRTEEEARKRTEEEARRRTEQEARKRTEEEARKRTEEEARKRTEEAARRRTEEEARRRTEEEARRRTEEEDRRAREEETQLVEVVARRGPAKSVPVAIPEESTQIHPVMTGRTVVSRQDRPDVTMAAHTLPAARPPAPPPALQPARLAAVKPATLAVGAGVVLIGSFGLWLLTRPSTVDPTPDPPPPIVSTDIYQKTLQSAREKYKALDIEGAVKEALSVPDTATEKAEALQLLATMRSEAADRATAARQTAQSTPPLDEEVMQQGARKMEEAARLNQPADTARVVALHEEAIAFFRKAPTTEWSADRLVREAQKANASQNRGTAIQLALQALERTPNFPGAVELLRSMRTAAATETANASRRARTAGMTETNSPGFKDARAKEAAARKIQNPADTQSALNLFGEATAAYASASIATPSDPPPPPPPNTASLVQGHLQRAEERLKAGDLAGANAALREAEKLDPSDTRLAELKKLAEARPPITTNRADIEKVLADAARFSNDADAIKLLTEQQAKYPGNAEIANALAGRTRARDLRISDLVSRARSATDERAVEFLDAALALNPARTDVREERERRFRGVARVQAERGVRDVLGKYEAAFEARSVAQFLNIASYRTATQIEDEFKSYRSIRMDINAVAIEVQSDGSASVTCTIRTVREPAGIRVKPITDERTWQLKLASAGGAWRITEATPAR